VLQEYTRRQQLVKKCRADRSPLFAQEFYRSPDFVESSQTDPTTMLPIMTDGQEFDVVPSSSSRTPSLIFSCRRKKRPFSHDKRDQIADKRFQLMMEELQETQKQIAEFTATNKTFEAQTDFHSCTVGYQIFI
jgi:hypothetical protein